MKTSYPVAAAFTRAQEGGYTNDSRDGGNWSTGKVGQGRLIGSNYGCGAPATITYMARNQSGLLVTAEWMRQLPMAVYDGMASSLYWGPLAGDTLPPGVDLSCFDFGWNTGVGSATRRLQWLVGASQDGKLGRGTLALIASYPLSLIASSLGDDEAKTLQRFLGVSQDGQVGSVTLTALRASGDLLRPQILSLGLGEAQEGYYRRLSQFGTYGQGWLNRTTARTIAAVSLASNLVPEAEAVYHPRQAVPAIEPDDAPLWVPFEPGIPITVQAGRLVN